MTTNTRGWQHLQQIAGNVLKIMVEEAIDEEDEVKGSAKRREAKAAREFWARYSNTIESVRSSDEPVEANELEFTY